MITIDGGTGKILHNGADIASTKMTDQWRITSDTDAGNSTETFITSNWARMSGDGYGTLGTGMSESSGVFTFPSTGIYLILAQFDWGNSSSKSNCYGYISVTQDNSDYSDASIALTRIADDNNNATCYCHHTFDVTDTSTHKVMMKVYVNNANTNLLGSSSRYESGFIFIRLGDT